VEFAGGEPYIKKGLLDLLRFYRDNDIHWGVTTNGGAYPNKKIVAQTVEARPFNINISIDSTDPKIHNYSRGVENSLNDIVQGIRNVSELRRAEGLGFPIIIKPVVHRLNFRRLPGMVDWIQKIGATALSFQPVEMGTQEVEDELWIGEQDMDDLLAVRDELLRLRRQGAPILNGEAVLNAWPTISAARRRRLRLCPAGSACETISSVPTAASKSAGSSSRSATSARKRHAKSGTARKPAPGARKRWRATSCACSPASRDARFRTSSRWA
jgi:MoaA/NifB/PqqE/SkfB family radical SAM enzyme